MIFAAAKAAYFKEEISKAAKKCSRRHLDMQEEDASHGFDRFSPLPEYYSLHDPEH